MKPTRLTAPVTLATVEIEGVSLADYPRCTPNSLKNESLTGSCLLEITLVGLWFSYNAAELPNVLCMVFGNRIYPQTVSAS